MSRSTSLPVRLLRSLVALFTAGSMLGGCAIVTVADTAVGAVASGVGLAVDAGVGAARITGRAIGAAADAVIPGGN